MLLTECQPAGQEIGFAILAVDGFGYGSFFFLMSLLRLRIYIRYINGKFPNSAPTLYILCTCT